MTDRKLAADQLRQAAAQAEQASLAKSQFLSALSHDLRTPVNALNLQVEWLHRLLARPRLPQGELLSLAADIRAAATGLGELVNDLLELCVIDSGVPTYNPSEFALDGWLEAVLAPLRLSAQAKNLDFSWSVDRPGRIVHADRVKLGRVLTNLVDNALKFTEQGSVRIAAGATPDGWLALAITDTGPGIPAEDTERIFDEFAQLRNPERDRTKGTGLGLAICRRLVRVSGGTLTVESRLGAGSCFTALYPPNHLPARRSAPAPVAAPAAAPPEPAAVPPASARGPILLVEDDPYSRKALARLLEREGYVVVAAADGPQALDLAAPPWPALVLLDLMLPGMDGIEVLRQLRAGRMARRCRW